MEPDDLMERFWNKVNKTESCWLWTGALNKGYGAFSIKNRAKQAHRLAYQFVKGEVPSGLELDHLCKTKHCVNPKHLEPVIHAENVRRGKAGHNWAVKTHCPSGHEYSASNTRINVRGSRECKKCHNLADKLYRQRRLSYAGR